MKKIIISIVFIILTAYASIGQTHETNESLIEGPVFVAVEQMPNFPGGNVKLMEYIGSHLQYPKVAQDKGIQGRVIVSFVWDENWRWCKCVIFICIIDAIIYAKN